MLHVHDHKKDPWICLQPSPNLSLEVLSTFIEIGSITATPRLGARNGDHPKGYTPGVVATLFLHDYTGTKHLSSRAIRIEAVTIRPLQELTPDDLHNTVWYHNWQDVQQELSYFEKRPVTDDEDVSIIKFSYL